MNQNLFKISKLTDKAWDTVISTRSSDLMLRSEYVKILAHSFNFKLSYILVEEKLVPKLGAVIFHRNKSVVFADNYTYQPLWIDPLLSERRQISALTELIEFLKKNFVDIKIKLNPALTDVRPFQWQGFSVETRYTYVRKLGTTTHKKIAARADKLAKNFSEVKIESASTLSINANLETLKQLGFNAKKIRSYRKLLEALESMGRLTSFTLGDAEGVLSAYLVLVDMESRKAYTLMVNSANRAHRQVHAILYQQIIAWADRNKISSVDFCGANMQGISNFKSYFNPELKTYYIVRYSILQKALQSISKVLNRL